MTKWIRPKDKFIEKWCDKCKSPYYRDYCTECFYKEIPPGVWWPIKDNFNLDSDVDFLIHTPDGSSPNLLVAFCSTDRDHCNKLHVVMVDSVGMGAKKYTEISIKECTHWMKIPNPPEGK